MSTLSRVLINPQKRGARKLLSYPQSMHAAVRAAFPPDIDESSARVLWRVDTNGPTHTLYVHGPEVPDLTHIVEQAGWPTRRGETADLEPFLLSLRRGQDWRFRLVANPVKSVPRGEGKRGKLMPLVSPKTQIEWLLKRSNDHGFGVRINELTMPEVAVTRTENMAFSKTGSPGGGGIISGENAVTLRTARFDGVLTVTDVESLRRSLNHGIGRGKAYGCGLLSLARETHS